MPFRFRRLRIPDVVLVTPKVFKSKRGSFMEVYKQADFREFGITPIFVQENQSLSHKNVLRGLHYQKPPMAQGKLVRVVSGEIFDVAVDIRRGSPTFGKHVSVRLSDKNRRMVYIPEGFAHGFCVLSDSAEVIYNTTKPYSPENERGIIWNDESLGIKWPVKDPLLSAKDMRLPRLSEAGVDFQYSKK